MGILSRAGSFTRYKVGEVLFAQGEIPERLFRRCFVSIDATTDERSFGWVNSDDFLDSAFKITPLRGTYAVFSLRLDTRRIQPAVFKKELRIAMDVEKAAMKENGKTFITKDRKQEIRDMVILKLRAKASPVPSVTDVVWNFPENTILLNTTNSKLRALFEDHFYYTFNVSLEPITPYSMALALDGKYQDIIDELEPAAFAGGL